MDIEEYIEKIVENGRVEDMEELSEMLEVTMDIVKDYDKDCYDDLMMKLYKMAYGSVITKEMAEELVKKMRPYGKKWDYEQTKRMQEDYGLDDVRNADFFLVINSAYNDYKDIFGDNVENYIKYTLDFIRDEDAKSDKIFIYYTQIPQ